MTSRLINFIDRFLAHSSTPLIFNQIIKFRKKKEAKKSLKIAVYKTVKTRFEFFNQFKEPLINNFTLEIAFK